MAVQTEVFSGTVGIELNIIGRQKHTSFFDRTVTEFVHIVPDLIDRPRHLLKQRPVAIFDPNLEGFGVFHTVEVYSIIKPAAPVALSFPALKDTGLVARYGQPSTGVRCYSLRILLTRHKGAAS